MKFPSALQSLLGPIANRPLPRVFIRSSSAKRPPAVCVHKFCEQTTASKEQNTAAHNVAGAILAPRRSALCALQVPDWHLFRLCFGI